MAMSTIQPFLTSCSSFIRKNRKRMEQLQQHSAATTTPNQSHNQSLSSKTNSPLQLPGTAANEKTGGLENGFANDFDSGTGSIASTSNANSPGPTERSSFLSVSQMVRQQSDTTHNNRRLMRSSAVCDDRPATSCNITREKLHMLSPNLQRPTKLVTVVDKQTNEEYIKLNQYRMMEEIGQGSYGIVKLAYNEHDKNLYALKVLDKIKLVKNFACFRPPPSRKNKPVPSVLKNPLQLVQREIAILKKLTHPNIVKLVAVLDDPNDNYLYMVFEYVERRSLLELPTENPLDEETAWKYFRDTLMGLEYLHFQKIVHRDIKPSNLLLSETEQVKIADFGVSCEFEGIDAFLTGTAGTPAFMAPEALTEDSSVFYSGRAQDIWSLGITLYALVVGNVPFRDEYIIALHKKIKNDPVLFPEMPKISEQLKSLILGMLKKDPGHRLMLHEIKQNEWVTKFGLAPMPSEEANCQLVTVTEEEIENSVRVIPRLDTLILVKAMGHRKRFGNPFRNREAAGGSVRMRRKSSSVKDPTYVPPLSTASAVQAQNSGLENTEERLKTDRPDAKPLEVGIETISLRGKNGYHDKPLPTPPPIPPRRNQIASCSDVPP
uniref:calcium/calmodulin-dependent protein kinase n=1 Tax=Acrobeloides nanus TaxID=290746 RepID=A0A914DZ55_9BILA